MGTGYVRNDTSNNIADGNTIDAADLDGEFDAVVAAFDASTGHTHDGTSAEGGPITVVGPTQDLVVSASALTPKTDDTLDLGSSSKKFKDLYATTSTVTTSTVTTESVGEIQAGVLLGTGASLSGTTPTVDCSSGDVFTLTTSGDTTFTFNYSGITLTTNDTYVMLIIVTSTGEDSLTWPGSVQWPFGNTPSDPASGTTSIYQFVTVNGGSTWYGVRVGQEFA